MVSAKEKSGNSTNLLRVKKGLKKKKKKAFEFSTLVDVDACMVIFDPKQDGQGTDHCPVEQEVHRIIQWYREYITTSTRDHEGAGIVTSSELDDALQKEGFLFNFEIEEDLKNEFMGFDELNVKINQMRITEEEEENLLDSSCTAAASSEFLVEGDNCIWPPSDELDEILNAFADNADDHHQENMFDLLHLSLPPTNACMDNILDSISDSWPTYSIVEWDQLLLQ